MKLPAYIYEINKIYLGETKLDDDDDDDDQWIYIDK